MHCGALKVLASCICSDSHSICIQVTVSNPAEVAKTRLQLQGELAKGGGVRVYNNSLDVFKKTLKNEGIRGLQRGLSPAVRIILSMMWSSVLTRL
jgi:solute carrier family 25 protein 34/35